MPEARPAFQYATLAQQHDAAQLGMWTFLATEVLFFGGLICAYSAYRQGYPADFAAAGRHTKIVIGTVNTAILLTSSFLVAWAVTAAKLGSGRLAAALLFGAALLGAMFLGLKGYEVSSWQAILAPAGTPKAMVDRLYRETVKALKMSDVIDRLGTQGGNELIGSTPEQFAALIKSEIQKYGKVIKNAGIRIDQ